MPSWPWPRSLEIAREIGDRRVAANALGNLGVVYAALSQAEKAIRHLQEAVAVANEIGDEALVRRMSERLSRINRSQSLRRNRGSDCPSRSAVRQLQSVHRGR
jgi:tetratricopeptide (TPR) repeat protein